MSDFLKSGQLVTGQTSLIYKGKDGIGRILNPNNYQPVGSYATTAQLNEVKASVSNGKSLIASAITDKGVSTASDATFQTMANNIRALPTAPTFKVPVAGTDFSYTGNYQILDDANGNWRIKLLTSGTFNFLKSFPVDLFLVGGGAGGAYGSKGSNVTGCYGRGGCGGYTKTIRNNTFAINSDIIVTIGVGGGAGQGSGGASIFGNTAYQANGGTYGQGGSGSGNGRGAAGSDGADGKPNTTETGFDYSEATGDLYSGGGGGCIVVLLVLVAVELEELGQIMVGKVQVMILLALLIPVEVEVQVVIIHMVLALLVHLDPVDLVLLSYEIKDKIFTKTRF